eukprot:gene8233-1469_t
MRHVLSLSLSLCTHASTKLAPVPRKLFLDPGSERCLDNNAGRYTQISPPYLAWNGEDPADPGLRIARCGTADCGGDFDAPKTLTYSNASVDPEPKYVRVLRLSETSTALVYVGNMSTNPPHRSIYVSGCSSTDPADPACLGSPPSLPSAPVPIDHGHYVGIFGAAVLPPSCPGGPPCQPSEQGTLAVAYPYNPTDGSGCELRFWSSAGQGPVTLAKLMPMTLPANLTPLALHVPPQAARPFSLPLPSTLPTSGFATATVATLPTTGLPLVAWWDPEQRSLQAAVCGDRSCASVSQRATLASSTLSSPGTLGCTAAWFDLGAPQGTLSAMHLGLNGTAGITLSGSTTIGIVHGSGTGPDGCMSDYGGGGFPSIVPRCLDRDPIPGPQPVTMVHSSGCTGAGIVKVDGEEQLVLLYFSESSAQPDGGGQGPGQLQALVCSDPACQSRWLGTVSVSTPGYGRDVAFYQLSGRRDASGLAVTLLKYQNRTTPKQAVFLRLLWAM